MTSVAVIAHAEKELEGGLPELRRILYAEGVTEPWWREVSKSKQVGAYARAALGDGADVIFVWGGDGTVQQCLDAVAGSGVAIAIVPAGTANLLATNLGVPKDIRGAVHVGLQGARRSLDLGLINGEHFAVMAGIGLDALMIRDAGAGTKDLLGRLSYIVAGAKHLRMKQVRARIRVDGKRWSKVKTSCVLFGNVGKIVGGITAFNEAEPDDGWLEVGVVTAKGLTQWIRIAGRTAAGQPERSPFVRTTRGRSFDIRLDRKTPYELDGGDRKPRKRFTVEIEPAAITVCVPEGKVG
ncbi:MAG: diacylglycerol/lipid kinase family protein [Actinomycetota bacterium]